MVSCILGNKEDALRAIVHSFETNVNLRPVYRLLLTTKITNNFSEKNHNPHFG
jgi:hypothetical protein